MFQFSLVWPAHSFCLLLLENPPNSTGYRITPNKDDIAQFRHTSQRESEQFRKKIIFSRIIIIDIFDGFLKLNSQPLGQEY